MAPSKGEGGGAGSADMDTVGLLWFVFNRREAMTGMPQLRGDGVSATVVLWCSRFGLLVAAAT